jgi:hypothetical protein
MGTARDVVLSVAIAIGIAALLNLVVTEMIDPIPRYFGQVMLILIVGHLASDLFQFHPLNRSEVKKGLQEVARERLKKHVETSKARIRGEVLVEA